MNEKEKFLDWRKPINTIFDNMYPERKIRQIYDSILEKLAENYKLGNKDNVFPKNPISADYLNELVINNHAYCELYGAYERYEFGNMKFDISYQHFGYDPITRSLYHTPQWLIILGEGGYVGRDNFSWFEQDPSNPRSLKGYDEFFWIQIFHPENKIEEFVKDKIINL